MVVLFVYHLKIYRDLQDRRATGGEEKDADITGLFDESDATGPTGASGDTPVARVVVPPMPDAPTDPLPRVLPGETGGDGGTGGAGGIYTDPNDLPPFPDVPTDLPGGTDATGPSGADSGAGEATGPAGANVTQRDFHRATWRHPECWCNSWC